MPKNISLFKVFLASPSDLKEERIIVENVINEFNNTFAEKLNSRIELLSWEKSTYPSIGECPQAVINSQIGDDYDIFIGILWTRFGSKTLVYESGTEEEFYHALKRINDGDKVQIMMYFNNESVPIDTLDTEQLSKVKTFQRKITELGCYYFRFDDSEHFKDELRGHLYKVVENWERQESFLTIRGKALSLPTASAVANPKEEMGEMEEIGLYEYQDLIYAKSEEVSKALKEISESTNWIGTQIADRTKRLNNLYLQRPYNQVALARDIINGTAKVMNMYAVRVEQPIQNWITSFEDMIDACNGMLQISDNLITNETWNDNKKAFQLLLDIIDTSYAEIENLYNSVYNLPKITQPIIVAKKNVCSNLKLLLDNMDKSKILTVDMIGYIEKKIGVNDIIAL